MYTIRNMSRIHTDSSTNIPKYFNFRLKWKKGLEDKQKFNVSVSPKTTTLFKPRVIYRHKNVRPSICRVKYCHPDEIRAVKAGNRGKKLCCGQLRFQELEKITNELVTSRFQEHILPECIIMPGQTFMFLGGILPKNCWMTPPKVRWREIIVAESAVRNHVVCSNT